MTKIPKILWEKLDLHKGTEASYFSGVGLYEQKAVVKKKNRKKEREERKSVIEWCP